MKPGKDHTVVHVLAALGGMEALGHGGAEGAPP